MSKKKGRDWSEWHKKLTGEEHIPNQWKAPRLENRFQHHEDTTASMVLPREFQRNHTEEKKMIKWILIFLCGLLLRKCYFEYTKYDRLRSETSNIAREKK